jgi:hypothetical protein
MSTSPWPMRPLSEQHKRHAHAERELKKAVKRAAKAKGNEFWKAFDEICACQLRWQNSIPRDERMVPVSSTWPKNKVPFP